MKSSIKFGPTSLGILLGSSPENCQRLLAAIVSFVETGAEPDDLPAWTTVKEDFDKRAKLSAVRAEAGRKGGKTTQAKQANVKQNQSKSEAKLKQNSSKTQANDITRAPASDGDVTLRLTSLEEEKNIVLLEEDTPLPPSEPTDFALVAEPVAKPTPPAAKAKFKKPDVFTVAAYCQERRNGVDAQAFVDFYESKGWMIGKNPMKDWKAAVRTWERQRNTPPSTADPTKFYNPEPTDWSKLGQTYGSSPITTPTPQTF